MAVTRAGQIKGRGERHEKDDRHRIDDRSRFVLGWSNEEKIAALKAEQHRVETRRAPLMDRIEKLTRQSECGAGAQYAGSPNSPCSRPSGNSTGGPW